MTAETTFKVTSWNESPYDEFDGGKLTRATVKKVYTGELQGEGTVEYLMTHRADGTADFVGLERIVGSLGRRAGSVVLRHEGSFVAGTVRSAWIVIPESGTGELHGLSGKIALETGHQEEYSVTLEYELP
jgi:hypothetical protein